jgi:hypothetical protein
MTTNKPRTIYALVDPRDNTTRYVGASANPGSRLSAHISSASTNCVGNKELVAWIRDVLNSSQNPIMKPLESDVSCDQWEDAEKYWIAELTAEGHKLLNILPGGVGNPPGIQMSQEWVERSKTGALKQTPRRPDQYVGVYYRPDRKRWQARIFVNRRCISLGSFKSPEAAARARDTEMIRRYGNNVYLNFPELLKEHDIKGKVTLPRIRKVLRVKNLPVPPRTTGRPREWHVYELHLECGHTVERKSRIERNYKAALCSADCGFEKGLEMLAGEGK